MRNTGLEETQAGIKIVGRNINNLRYTDDTTLMAESEEELKSLLMKVLKKTLESPLNCKEIQPVHSEGDQPWDFFGRNDAKAETPVLWPLMRRVDSLEKTLMLGGIEGRRRRGRQRMR